MADVLLAPHQLGHGGRTVAIADQCAMFMELGHHPVVVTYTHVSHLLTLQEYVQSVYGIPDGVPVRNIYADLLHRNPRDFEARWSRDEDESVGDYLMINDAQMSLAEKGADEASIKFADDVIKCHTRDRQGNLHEVRYYRGRNIKYRRIYDSSGFCSLEYRYDDITGTVNQENYYTPDGFCYLVRWINASTGRHAGLFQTDRKTRRVTRFDGNTSWHVSWLNDILGEFDSKPTLVAHSAGSARKVLRVPSSAARRIFVWHENHIDRPYRSGGRIREDYREVFDRFRDMPVVVVATQAQADELRARYPGADNIRVIPPIVDDKRTGSPIVRESGRIGVFARLAPGKRIPHVIEAMSHVVDEFPAATLHIYGSGPEREHIQSLAHESRCASSIEFHGRTQAVSDEMARCDVTVSASEVESFGLSVGESLAVGTPVVSYDITYGPSDVVRDGIDGYLVPDGDIRALAQAIIAVLESARDGRPMAVGARERIREEFGRESVARRWSAILHDGQIVE